MTRHDPLVRVRHMLDHAREAVEMARGSTRADLDTQRQLSLALMRLMEVVGEAAARVPEAFRQQHPNLPWQDIADLRNRLIHGYDNVDLQIVWDVVKRDIPQIKPKIGLILKEYEG